MFKKIHTFENRSLSSKRVLVKHPDRVPVIVERSDRVGIGSVMPVIDKKKYLAHSTTTVGQFQWYIRNKRLGLKDGQAFFLFFGSSGTKLCIPPQSQLMSELYRQMKDEDGFLYCMYQGESTFGSSDQKDCERNKL
jgi:GABA(A) receptor-associated protein